MKMTSNDIDAECLVAWSIKFHRDLRLAYGRQNYLRHQVKFMHVRYTPCLIFELRQQFECVCVCVCVLKASVYVCVGEELGGVGMGGGEQ